MAVAAVGVMENVVPEAVALRDREAMFCFRVEGGTEGRDV